MNHSDNLQESSQNSEAGQGLSPRFQHLGQTENLEDGQEKWVPVTGYEKFYVINQRGDVKRIGRAKGAQVGKILKPALAQHGYWVVSLHKPSNANTKTFYVHRLLAQAFIPNPNNLSSINHKDGNRANNLISNIEWTTQRDNLLHRSRVLGKERGSNHHAAKTNEQDVSAMWGMLESGVPRKEILRKFGISRGILGHIIRGDCWAHVSRGVVNKCYGIIKYDKDTVLAIRRDKSAGLNYSDLSLKYGCSRSHARRICDNESRSNIQ